MNSLVSMARRFAFAALSLLSTVSAQGVGGPGYALQFFHDGSYVEVPGFHPTFNAYPITITGWIGPGGFGPAPIPIISKSSFQFDGWRVGLLSGELRASYYRDSLNYVSDEQGNGMNGGFVADGAWHHIAFTVDSAGGRLYVDGALRAVRPWVGTPGALTTAEQVRLGGGFGFNGPPYRGLLDEVTIWNVALSQEEIQANKNRSLTGAEPGLLAYYRCDESACCISADSAPFAGDNQGIWNGGVSWTPSSIQPFTPDVETLAASGVTARTATLNGGVNPAGTNTSAWFEWGTTTNYGNITAIQPMGNGTFPVNFSQSLTGLLTGITYHFRAVASNALGVSIGGNRSFNATTAELAPITTTTPASQISVETARLNGTCNPRGTNATAWFELGTTINYGTVVPGVLIGSGATAVPYGRDVAGLQPSTTYYFRAVGSNAHGVTFGANQTFTTEAPRPPVVTTVPATGVVVEIATLRGSVNPTGVNAVAWFEWGRTTNYGNLTPPLFFFAGNTNLTYTNGLTGLQGGTTYYFRAAASNKYATTFGTGLSFTTRPAQLASVITQSSSAGGHSASLSGLVNPQGSATVAWFEWGTTTNYGNTTPPNNRGNGTNFTSLSYVLLGLAPETTYYFRVVASNVVGLSFGTNQSFTTAAVITGVDFEPNNTPAVATPLFGPKARITSNLYPSGDLDYFSFTAEAGDRLYAAVTSPIGDAALSVIDADGETELETDDDDGNFGPLSPSLAGVTIPAAGTYYLRVSKGLTFGYDLWFRLASGSPSEESESNDGFPGQILPASGWVSGNIDSFVDLDYFRVDLNAGDTVFVSLDLDPERDGLEWDGVLAMGLFGTPGTLLQTNDLGTATPDSEALVLTVKNSGAYGIRVAPAPNATSIGTYRLSAIVFRPTAERSSRYASADVPVSIGPDPGYVTSSLTIPDDKRIGRLQVFVNLNHTRVADVSASLTAPDGNTVALLNRVGSFTAGIQTNMDLGLDDRAALSSTIGIFGFSAQSGIIMQPERDARLSWFSGQQAQGTWTLTIRDDTATNGGTLRGWSLVVFDEMAPVGAPATIYSTDFETNDGGFTHSGQQDEWQRGMPNSPPITTCHSGVNCWKTDLATNYNANATNDLFSPNISLANVRPTMRIVLSWAMKYQFDRDPAFIEAQEVGGSQKRTIWAFVGSRMTQFQGNPQERVDEAAGWGIHRALISDFAGKTIRIRFHFESDAAGQLAGWAIDDVSVKVYPPIVQSGNDFGINFAGTPERIYRAQYTTDLSGVPAWNDFTPPATFMVPAGGVFGFTDVAPTNRLRFYRAAPSP